MKLLIFLKVRYPIIEQCSEAYYIIYVNKQDGGGYFEHETHFNLPFFIDSLDIGKVF